MSRLPILLACLLLAFSAVACGGDDDEEAAAPQETATSTTTPEPAGNEKPDIGKISAKLDEKPKIAKPTGPPPAQLVKRDVVKGKGKAAKPGDTVSVQYVGVSWSTGVQFDASWDRGGEPFAFQLGAGRVIKGWDQGVAGMKVGGRRALIIPPDLAYGTQSPDPSIGPNETLVFVVDLKKVA